MARKTEFRLASEAQQVKAMNELTNDDSLDEAEREYLLAINDPMGPVYKAAYGSFRKGQEAREETRRRISVKYGVTEESLEHAGLIDMATKLNGGRKGI